MTEYKSAFLGQQLSKRTSIFGLRLWVIIGICLGASFVLLLFLISLWITSRRNSSSKRKATHKASIPNVSKEILEVQVDHHSHAPPPTDPLPESETAPATDRPLLLLPAPEGESPVGLQRIHIEIGKDHRIVYPERGGGATGGSSQGSGESRPSDQAPAANVPEVSHLGWGHWYTLRELEDATGGFSDENVIGEGGYGIVYRGVMEDGAMVAVKNLLNNRSFFLLGPTFACMLSSHSFIPHKKTRVDLA